MSIEELRREFESGLTRPLQWRIDQLDGLIRLLRDHEDDLVEALGTDLGKGPFEGWLTEVGFLSGQIEVLRRSLRKWIRPERVRVGVLQRPGRARVLRDPLGVVLVISPWNYPVHLLLLPMASALAAGNVVVAKPSELAPATSRALASLIPKYLDNRAVRVIEGGVETAEELLAERFDHIFFTGSTRVGSAVYAAAAKNLVPVTLELGGKSPTIVDRDSDLAVAARRIAWAKYLNAGQSCIAPDYVLVHRDVQQSLIDNLVKTVAEFYGDSPDQSPDYGRIVNSRHLDRLIGLLEGQESHLVLGGKSDPEDRYLSPTILEDTDPNSAVMTEEIFGPILPVIGVDSIDEAVTFVKRRPTPLALYIFSRSKSTVRRVLEQTSSGGVCVNGASYQYTVSGLPFGGTAESGMGVYHGRWGFETFSHPRAVLIKKNRPDPKVVYPPYTPRKESILRRLL